MYISSDLFVEVLTFEKATGYIVCSHMPYSFNKPVSEVRRTEDITGEALALEQKTCGFDGERVSSVGVPLSKNRLRKTSQHSERI